MLKSIAVLCLAVLSAAPAQACEGFVGAQDLVRRIDAKFGLGANAVSYRCGGSGVKFYYKPPENLVPDSSFYRSWNSEFTLGVISDESDLRAMLALTPAQMDALVMANVHHLQDSYEAENAYGVSVYHPNALRSADRLAPQGMLMYVTAPHCAGRQSRSAEHLGSVHFPVFSLEGVSLIAGGAPLYKKNDLMRIVRANSLVLGNLHQVARDNMAALAKDPQRTECDRGMEPGARVFWQSVLLLR